MPLGLLLASFLILSVSTRQIVKWPGSAARVITGGAQFVFTSIGDLVEGTVFSIRELRNLKSEYTALSEKMTEYANLERDLANLRAENDRLREQLGFARNVTQILASARIIAKDPTNLYSSFEIDKGSSSGLKPGMAAVAFQDGFEGLAGKLLEVSAKNAKVLPLYDRKFFVSARLSRTRTEGLVNGEGEAGGEITMRYVSKLRAAELQKGDLVTTSGLDSIFPPDLAIGRVSSVEMPEYGSSALIRIEPVLDFSSIEYLFLLTRQETEPEAVAGGEE